MKRRLPFVLVFLALLLAEGVWLLADLRAAQTETPATQRLPPAVMSDSGDAAWASSTSADGRYIAFVSSAANLVAGDRDASPDIFVYDRQTGVMECVSVTSDEHDLESRFDAPSISDDGRYVVFEGWSYTLVPGSSGYVSEIYLHDRQTGATTLLTTSAIAEELIDGNSFDATISADGRYVVFASEATNLVSGDTNDAVDIFLHDVSAGGTRRVSLRGAATQAGGDSGAPTVSADGRFVAFHSNADSLVNGDTNNQSDVFVRNVAAGTTTRVSVGAGGAQGDGPSWQGVISDNGRYVAFESLAANFAADDDNDAGDVFIRDRQANTTALVSRDADGHPAAGGASEPSLSADGAQMAFTAGAALLPDGLGETDVYVSDWKAGTIRRVSVSGDVAAGNGRSFEPALSADGTAVSFTSTADNLSPDDLNGSRDIFLRDLEGEQTVHVSTDAFPFTEPNGPGGYPAPSFDGRYVAFGSWASNIVPGDDNMDYDVFVTDRQTGQTTAASLTWQGDFGRSVSPDDLAISDDGRIVAFSAWGADFVEGDDNGAEDVFVRDRQTGETTLVSISSDGGQHDGAAYDPALSGDGNLVAFVSWATNLVPDDNFDTVDIFVRDRAAGTTTRVSVNSEGENDYGYSDQPDVAAGGRYVVFSSNSPYLAPNDENDETDIFLHDLQTAETALISRSMRGGSADSYSVDPAVSGDGRYVAFASGASDLVTENPGCCRNIYLYDRQADLMKLATRGYDGTPALSHSYQPAISNDGRYVTFLSRDSNLTPGDTNGVEDIFVYDRLSGVISRVVAGAGTPVMERHLGPTISGDGTLIGFSSTADNLVAGDTYGFMDAFVVEWLANRSVVYFPVVPAAPE